MHSLCIEALCEKFMRWNVGFRLLHVMQIRKHSNVGDLMGVLLLNCAYVVEVWRDTSHLALKTLSDI